MIIRTHTRKAQLCATPTLISSKPAAARVEDAFLWPLTALIKIQIIHTHRMNKINLSLYAANTLYVCAHVCVCVFN